MSNQSDSTSNTHNIAPLSAIPSAINNQNIPPPPPPPETEQNTNYNDQIKKD